MRPARWPMGIQIVVMLFGGVAGFVLFGVLIALIGWAVTGQPPPMPD